MFTKEVSVVVMALCVVKLVTSGDEVVLPSSSSGVNITGNMRSMNEDQVMSLHELLKRKMERTRGLVSLGMDPFQAGSMGFLIQEPGAYINVSLTKVINAASIDYVMLNGHTDTTLQAVCFLG
ncbi:hypothetical protein HPB51_009715 [Rhipicephalus microplus]|uniref:Uncharacterized protein n=1 Tax=Rhipicephalus microplus TaxID=6941 RepID=A0A9J6ETA9_RHIMP|nr:hypothetical protein HPB51_009715 [Rhipicephalus microplus]